MNSFSDWRENPAPINESTSLESALRSRLNSSTPYLQQAFGIKPEAAKEPLIQEGLEQQLNNLEEKIKAEIEKTREEIAAEKEEVVEKIVEEVKAEDDDTYKLYRDREENFECNISIEGAALSSASTRIVIDTSLFNLVFYGKLYKDGKCLIPLKKMTMFPEGTRGQMRLEVIVDDTVFSPWESSCVIEGAKKVFVDVKQKKNVSVNFGETTKS